MSVQINFHIDDHGVTVDSYKYEDFVTLTVCDDKNNRVSFFLRKMEDVVSFQNVIHQASKNLAEIHLNVPVENLTLADFIGKEV